MSSLTFSDFIVKRFILNDQKMNIYPMSPLCSPPEPPELILDAGMTREVKAMAGTHITLMAAIKGIPFPSVIWKKNDAEVPTRADIETNQEGTKLEMRFCNRDDCGDYTLTVDNPAGSKTVTCTVLVLGKNGFRQIQKLCSGSVCMSNS